MEYTLSGRLRILCNRTTQEGIGQLFASYTDSSPKTDITTNCRRLCPRVFPKPSYLEMQSHLRLASKTKSKTIFPSWSPLYGDRIAGGLPMVCCAVTSNAVQLLIAPALLSSHSQVIGRMKSKTASQLLWSPERTGQKHIWSSGYWFANINGAEAVAKVEHYIHEQRSN